jgi:3-deoxy-7-phosphoheptulonate synthase
MIIQIEKTLTAPQKEELMGKLGNYFSKITEVQTQKGNYLVSISKQELDVRTIGQIPGVRDVHVVSDDYQLVSGKWKIEPSTIELGDGEVISQKSLTLMAGPCSIESEEQIEAIVQHLVENNIKIMRGGVFKPRSSPYSFRGLGIDGLKTWSRIARANGIKIISEVMQVSEVEEMYDYIDIYQVGARNTQNFNLLDALGKVDKAVMIKRGISGSIEELLYSAEYVFSGGNENIILCERGIRTFEKMTRNTLDLNAVPLLKDKTHLPVIVDPSHGIGIRNYVEPVALAGVMAGADGLVYEIHPIPEKAYSDAQQTLDFKQSAQLAKRARETYALRQNWN